MARRAERRRVAPRSAARRAYCTASRLCLALSWLPTWIPVLFWAAPRVGDRLPSWWPSDTLDVERGFDATFRSHAGWTALWYRARDGLLLYREVTF